MSTADSATLADTLQKRLTACNDLHLTLKHVHWNVVGPNFILVQEMLDPQVEQVRGFADVLAECIATLGGSPVGTMGVNADHRSWDDYSLGRDTAQARLGALDKVYDGMIGDHRKAIAVAGDVDPVTEDLLIGQTAERARYMTLRAQGMSIRRAGREMGVSRTSANKWERGYWRYRGAEKVVWVPPLGRLDVRVVSPRFLAQDERLEIADLDSKGRRSGRSPSAWVVRRRRSPGS